MLTEFVATVAKLRAEHPVFRRRRFFQGRPIRGSSIDDIAWLRPDARHMNDADWGSAAAPALAVYLNGDGIPELDPIGERVRDDSFLLLFNTRHQAVTFTLPDESYGRLWELVVDTADPLLAAASRRRRPMVPGTRVRVLPTSLQVLRRRI